MDKFCIVLRPLLYLLECIAWGRIGRIPLFQLVWERRLWYWAIDISPQYMTNQQDHCYPSMTSYLLPVFRVPSDNNDNNDNNNNNNNNSNDDAGRCFGLARFGQDTPGRTSRRMALSAAARQPRLQRVNRIIISTLGRFVHPVHQIPKSPASLCWLG